MTDAQSRLTAAALAVMDAATLDRRYRECRDMGELRQLWTDTADARKRVIAADDAFKDVFAKVLEREKARLAGEGVGA